MDGGGGPERRTEARAAPERAAGCPPAVVAALALGALLAAPWLWALPPATLAVAATATVLLGVPHGAVDHRVARPLLRPRLGRAWFAAFTVGYLGLAALVLGAWAALPALSLWLFLAVSVWHFGLEDAEGRGALARLARGGAPVALPILIHPERTERFFAVLAGGEAAFFALAVLAWAWLPLGLLHLAGILRRGDRHEALEVGAVALAFAALPPLAGFAFYFLAVHSPRHMDALARRRAPGDPARGWIWALRASAPLTLATALLGALVFAALPGTVEERVLRTVFWGLAALTVPHVLLHHLDRRAGEPPLR